MITIFSALATMALVATAAIVPNAERGFARIAIALWGITVTVAGYSLAFYLEYWK